MRRSVLFLMTILTGWTLGEAVPPSWIDWSARSMQAPSNGEIGASAVWQPSQDLLSKAHLVCEKGAGPASFAECFLNQIAAGAPADAVSFTSCISRMAGWCVS